MSFFTERESTAKARTIEEVTPSAWRGIVGAISSRIHDGSFGQSYPEQCPDGRGVTGTDQYQLARALKTAFPKLRWPLNPGEPPQGFLALDLIEFCYERVALPTPESTHTFFCHEHLTFDIPMGREEFRRRINQIFERNGLAFSLEPNGRVVRLTAMLFHEAFSHPPFATGDVGLDELLAQARLRFLSHDPNVRLAGLENLWDAWQRLRNLDPDARRRGFSPRLLYEASPEPHFRRMIEHEIRALSEMGNDFMIRQNDLTKIPISAEDADYIFRRLWAMIRILLHAIDASRAEAPVDAGNTVQHA